MRFIIIFILCFMGFVLDGNAQKEKKAKNKTTAKSKSKAEKMDNAFSPFSPEETKAPSKQQSKKSKQKSFKNSYNKGLDDKKQDFQKRVEANARKYKKIAREMEKPQYSDPSYFGHKNKPKKRNRGKRKFCKECGITH